MYYFCTYFDYHYLLIGLALYHSLEKVCDKYKLFILCLDNACYQKLSELQLPNVALISLEEFEAEDRELLRAKENRSVIEYYFTCTASLPLYILRRFSEVDLITYLDSDLFFFRDPRVLFDEMGANSVAIVGHRYSPKLKWKEIYGKFNVGWLSFRRDDYGLACLQWYREKCLEWCYDRLEPDRFADQKYLDHFAANFAGVIELEHKGANLAPWNIDNYRLSTLSNLTYVDEDQLIFFHFQGLKNIFGNFYDSAFSAYKARLTELIRREIFLPYLICRNNLLNDNLARDLLKDKGIRSNKIKNFIRYAKRLPLILMTNSIIYYRQ